MGSSVADNSLETAMQQAVKEKSTAWLTDVTIQEKTIFWLLGVTNCTIVRGYYQEEKKDEKGEATSAPVVAKSGEDEAEPNTASETVGDPDQK